jgi:hypothetical protein
VQVGGAVDDRRGGSVLKGGASPAGRLYPPTNSRAGRTVSVIRAFAVRMRPDRAARCVVLEIGIEFFSRYQHADLPHTRALLCPRRKRPSRRTPEVWRLSNASRNISCRN